MTEIEKENLALQDASEYLFAKHCKLRRQQLGMSQEKVASMMRRLWIMWHQTAVAKIEDGSRAIKLDEAYALANVYGMKLEDLIYGRGIPGQLEKYTEEIGDGETVIRFRKVAEGGNSDASE